MFPEMRRKNQQLSGEECVEILENADTGILGVAGCDGYPYTVPLNFVYSGGKIIFHCAKQGHKLDAIKNNDKVSFCVIGRDTVIPETLSTNYSSVIIFGRAKIIEDKQKLAEDTTLLGLKYSHDKEKIVEEIKQFMNSLCCVEISIEHMTGKRNKQ